jgi:hypothetical protein
MRLRKSTLCAKTAQSRCTTRHVGFRTRLRWSGSDRPPSPFCGVTVDRLIQRRKSLFWSIIRTIRPCLTNSCRHAFTGVNNPSCQSQAISEVQYFSQNTRVRASRLPHHCSSPSTAYQRGAFHYQPSLQLGITHFCCSLTGIAVYSIGYSHF